MSYAVLVQQLRAAASDYRSVAGNLGTESVEINHVEPDSFGHIELAAWVKAVADQCEKATTALHDGATGLAGSLDAAANHYETTDDQVRQVFTQPFNNGLLTPGGGPR